jgi:hypothetical protein
MKKLLALFVTVFSLSTAWAQIELKINPIGALFKSPDISAEFAVNKDIGIEPYLGANWYKLEGDNKTFKSNGVGYGIFGKYYFAPEKGIDNFYAGVYLKGGSSDFSNDSANIVTGFHRNRLSAGLSLGYKWVSQKNVVFEVGGGLGRKIFNKFSNELGSVNIAKLPILNIDGYIKFAVGYRFGGGNSSSTTKKMKKS